VLILTCGGIRYPLFSCKSAADNGCSRLFEPSINLNSTLWQHSALSDAVRALGRIASAATHKKNEVNG